ncbi:MAG TPA: SRPBCC family protein [Aliidongia sp.]|nr:SRPBCC family protein [Aliidongia sp.]
MTMKLLLLAFSLTAAMGAAVTGANAATPELKVSQSVDIAATPDKVWAVIKNFKDLTWHPAIKASDATADNNVGSVRTLDLGGPKLEEQLKVHSNAMMSYTYKITDKPDNVKVVPVTHYESTIKVEKTAHGSKVVWSGHFHRADPSAKPADGQDDQAAIKAITGIYRGGLDALKQHVENAS